MTNQKPSWLPWECVYYGAEQLKSGVTSREEPHTLFGVIQKGQPGYIHTTDGGIIGPTSGGPNYHWSIDYTEKEEALFRKLQLIGVESFCRMYQGLDLAVMDTLRKGHVLEPKPGQSHKDYLDGVDNALVRPELLIAKDIAVLTIMKAEF